MMRVGQIVQRVDGPEVREVLEVSSAWGCILTDWWLPPPCLKARAWSHTEGWKLAPWGLVGSRSGSGAASGSRTGASN